MIGLTACVSNGTQSVGADTMGRTIPERISDSSIELTARRNLATIRVSVQIQCVLMLPVFAEKFY